MAVIVYRYGTPAWIELPPVVNEQLRLAWELREDLVTLQHEYEEQVRTIWSSYPAVAAAEKRCGEVEARVEELAAKVAAERQRQRTRAPKHPVVNELRQARAELRQARQARRDAIAAVREQASKQLAVAAEKLRAAQKALYADYVQSRGLYWATYNDVLANHRTAVQRIARQRSQGRSAQLRHHRWDGSGSVAVQLQRSADKPPRSPRLLASGEGPWRNVLQISQGNRHGTVRMRIGAELVPLPVVVHTDMDPDADITGARLTVRRVAGQRRVHLTLTAKLPNPEPVTDGVVLAVHCGWRAEGDDGTVRVATWRASAPVTVPQRLRDIVRRDSATEGIVVMPGPWRDRIARSDLIRAERDTRLEKIRGELVEWLTTHPLDDEEVNAAAVARWRSPARFARLAWAWHHNTPPGAEEITAKLMAWRRWDRAAWERQEHGRRKHLGRRDDAWRRFAAWAAATAAVVVVDDSDLAAIARRSTRQETSLPTEVTAIAARQRVDAAPGGLRAAVVSAARREGVTVVTVPAAGLSAQCYHCGHDGNEADGHELECAGCGRVYDRDAEAVAHMLRRARG